MKATKKAAKKSGRAAALAENPRAPRWPYAIGFFLALAAAFQVYGPSLYGPFLFDDQGLPFEIPGFPVDKLRPWVAGVRPVLMFSYWINYQLSGFQTLSYHAFNVFFHAANAVLVFFILRKIADLAQVDRSRRDRAAVFGAALFLLHPVNTESVGYVASRSENLSLLFFFGAFAVFLYRPVAQISWARASGVLVLFGLAALTKEHTIVLPALLLLTDYFWNPPFSSAGIRRNWKLYVPIACGGAGVALYLMRLLRHAPTAGFGLKDLTWYQYFFTQCRAFWVYIRLFVFPAGLTIDYDFPISRTILDHGALAGLIAISLAAGAAFYFRRRYPLASYGFFAFLILLTPTSSFVPIRDPIAERRMYLSMIGLLFIVMELVRRVDMKQPRWLAAMAGLLVIAGVASHSRNFVWSDKVVLWEDTASKSPNKSRVQFQLAQAYYESAACAKALPHYARTAELDPSDDTIFIDWGLAYDCLNQPDQALAKFRQAIAVKPTAHAYSQIGMIYGKQAKYGEALNALAAAEKLDPNFEHTYVYRGDVHLAQGQAAIAVEDFRRALAIDPRNQKATQDLGLALAQLRNRR